MYPEAIVHQVLKHFPELKKVAALLPIEAALEVAVRLAFRERAALGRSPGLRLQLIREEQDITQKELAALVGTSQGNISAIESGARPLGPKTARRLAKVLDCDFRELI